MKLDGIFYDGKPIRGINGIPLEALAAFHAPISASEEVTFECEVDSALLEKLTGRNPVPMSRSFTVKTSAPYKVQIRRHRKKRINKKWAKRYGYKTMLRVVELSDATMVPVGLDDLEFDIIGKGRCYDGPF